MTFFSQKIPTYSSTVFCHCGDKIVCFLALDALYIVFGIDVSIHLENYYSCVLYMVIMCTFHHRHETII